MNRLFCCCLLCLSLCACGPAFSGGAHYSYQYSTPDGKIVNLDVKSNRDVESGVEVNIDPETGKVNVTTGAMTGGPNNTKVMLETLIKAFIDALQASAMVTP